MVNQAGLAGTTANRYLAAFKTMFGAAKLWGYVSEAPTDGLKMLKEFNEFPRPITRSPPRGSNIPENGDAPRESSR